MLLLDSVEAVTAEGGTGLVQVDPSAWYADAAGSMPAWFGLELMAQTIAACRGRHLADLGGAPRGGYLVGTRSYRSTLAAFPAGASLAVRVRLEEADPSGLGTFRCEILLLGLPVAEAVLKVMER
jgi:predicted hotdog family 3-hydroxylacyl-ACP dehydratase